MNDQRITARELRIGNYIQGAPMSVPRLGFLSDGVQTIQSYGIHLVDKGEWYPVPVPLTEEWLQNFGFYLHEESRHKFPATKDLYDKSKVVERLDRYYKFRYDRSDPETDSRDMDVLVVLDPETLEVRSMGIVGVRDLYCCADIHYVHQLQNLYFALTGEELTIKETAS